MLEVGGGDLHLLIQRQDRRCIHQFELDSLLLDEMQRHERVEALREAGDRAPVGRRRADKFRGQALNLHVVA